jgi:hypothetical protein
MVRVQSVLTAGRAALLLILFNSFNSCAPWLLPPLRVLSCSLEEDEGGLFLRFSAPLREDSLVKAFSMAEDGVRLEGRFDFAGEEAWFHPVNGVREGRTYELTISTAAEDRLGNSLETDYRREFTTRAEGEAPRVVTILPADNSVLKEAPKEILIRFSEAVDPVSFEEALRINPFPSYVIRWNGDYDEVLIQPVKPLSLGTRYIISISTALQDRARNGMVLPFTGSFLLGDDRSPPALSLEWVNSAEGVPLPLAEGLKTGLPPDAEFDISFTREVEIESLGAYLELQPSLGLTVKPERNSRTKARISFTQRPAWGERYNLIIRRGIGTEGGGKTEEDSVFSLVFDAPQYMPPQFLRGFLDIRSGMKILSEEGDFDSLALDPLIFKPVPGGIEAVELCMVFCTSQEADSLAPSTAMEALSISAANACVYISIKKMRVLDEASYRNSVFNDSGLEAGEGKKLCALVYGLEIENTQRLGLIVFSIKSFLKDLLGNPLGRDITITWNKE